MGCLAQLLPSQAALAPRSTGLCSTLLRPEARRTIIDNIIDLTVLVVAPILLQSPVNQCILLLATVPGLSAHQREASTNDLQFLKDSRCRCENLYSV